jgi:uncharacterized membrane protein YkoI
MPRRLPIACLCCLALIQAQARPVAAFADAAVGTPAAALEPMQERPPREPGPADLKEAIDIALERYGGEAADAETVERDGRQVHEVKLLLADGSVRTVRIDPGTGAIIPPRER